MNFLDGLRFICLLVLPISGSHENTNIVERLNDLEQKNPQLIKGINLVNLKITFHL